MTLYDDLGVSKDATAAEIKKAHRAGVKKHHPDKGGSAEKFGALQKAFDVLSDDSKRAHYDRTGDADAPSDPEELKRRQAMNVVISAIQAAISNAKSVDHENIILSAAAFIDNSETQLKRQVQEAQKKRATLETVRRRMKRKKEDGPDVIVDMLTASITDLERQEANVQDVIATHAAARALLHSYTYQTEPGREQTQMASLMQILAAEQGF